MPDFAPLTSRGSLPGLDTFIVLNVPKILNILEIVHPLPTTHIEPIILMSSLNCAIINCYKITRTKLVCSKGDVADPANNNAPLAYFNTANEDSGNNTSVLLNDGKTSSTHPAEVQLPVHRMQVQKKEAGSREESHQKVPC